MHINTVGYSLYMSYTHALAQVDRSLVHVMLTNILYRTFHIKDPSPLFEKSRVVILVAGFLFVSHRYGHPTPWRCNMGDPFGYPGNKTKRPNS